MPAGVVITGLNITNCDASGGEEIDASSGGTDGGGNTNINFGGGYGAGLIIKWEDDREE
jgi:hypothetical protein